MVRPEVTIKLMRRQLWGTRAMERRVNRCCADNPTCSLQDECFKQYVKFVDEVDVMSIKRNTLKVTKKLQRKLQKKVPLLSPLNNPPSHPLE